MTLQVAGTALRAAIGAPEPVTWIEAAGTRLAAMRRGTGPAVLCLHAIGHGARDFELLADRIGDRFEIIALDWPGQGRSPDDGVAADAVHYARLALAVLDALGLDRAILVGNSIGGAASLRLAASRPDRVAAWCCATAAGWRCRRASGASCSIAWSRCSVPASAAGAGSRRCSVCSIAAC